MVITEGDSGTAPLVVLIHGFAANKDQGVIPLLFERLSSYSSVISFDLPGHGSSTTSFDSITFPLLLDAIDSVLDEHAKGRPLVLVGHSMGGALAYLLARRRSDITRLVLLAPGFSIRSRFLLSLKEEALRNGSASFSENGRDYRVSKAFFESREFDALDLAPHITQPTLIIVGELDYTVDQEVCRHVADALPSGSFVLARNEGHGLTDLSYWDAIVSFLDQEE